MRLWPFAAKTEPKPAPLIDPALKQEITPAEQSSTPDLVIAPDASLFSLRYFGGWDPEVVASALRLADSGVTYSAYWLFTRMQEVNSNLASAIEYRNNAIRTVHYEILPNPSDPDVKLAQEKAELVHKVYQSLDWGAWVAAYMTRRYYGIGGSEVQWGYQDGVNTIIQHQSIVHEKFQYDWQTGRLQFSPKDDGNYSDVRPFQFILWTDGVRPFRSGLLRKLIPLTVFKTMDWRAWVTFLEMYGMPIRVGKYPQGSAKEIIDKIAAACRQMGIGGWAVIPEGGALELLESSASRSGDVYDGIMRRINAEEDKLIKGQALTTEYSSDKGGYAQSQTGEAISYTILSADCMGMEYDHPIALHRPIVGYNFGWDEKVMAYMPRLKLKYERGEDQERRVRVFTGALELASKAQEPFPLSLKQLRKDLNLALPDGYTEAEDAILPNPDAAVNPFLRGLAAAPGHFHARTGTSPHAALSDGQRAQYDRIMAALVEKIAPAYKAQAEQVTGIVRGAKDYLDAMHRLARYAEEHKPNPDVREFMQKVVAVCAVAGWRDAASRRDLQRHLKGTKNA